VLGITTDLDSTFQKHFDIDLRERAPERPLSTVNMVVRGRRTMMSKTGKSEESLTVTLASSLVTITVGGVGRPIALGAIAALTFLGALYIYLAF
jgi:hypothetical protein